MTIKELIDLASKEIGYIDAKVLMKYILNKDISYIVSNSDEEMQKKDENKYDSTQFYSFSLRFHP